VDTQRLAHYYSQLSEHGLVVQAKHSSKSGGQEASTLKAGLPWLGGQHKQGKSAEEAVELQIDPAFRRPQETLDALYGAGFLKKGLGGIGQLCLMDGVLTIIDLRLMKELWPYVGGMLAEQQTSGISHPKEKERKAAEIKKNFGPMAEILQRLPHSIQGSMQDYDGNSSWYTLKPEFLTVNPEDLVFKCGCDIPGFWKMVCIVDAYPDQAFKADHSQFFSNDIESAMRQMMGGMQTAFGRPPERWGITPIMIFRTIKKPSDNDDDQDRGDQEPMTGQVGTQEESAE
jgi:hypothetical protein